MAISASTEVRHQVEAGAPMRLVRTPGDAGMAEHLAAQLGPLLFGI